ncbi:MAG: DNA translocase FtsK 4TM domain-containing protein [Candidatus Eisenbacteria sp.]|nr:DNA translocase FtsK 4TM domain-containing protein [Candidatus Eisenbacteria bacterium]
MVRRRKRSTDRIRKITGVVLFSSGAVISVWLALCHWRGITGLAYDSEAERAVGKFGLKVASLLIEYSGYLSWCLPFLLVFWSVALFRKADYVRTTLWTLFALLLVPLVAGLSHFLQVGWIAGFVGGYVSEHLIRYFGIPVAPLLLVATLVVMLLLAIPDIFDPLGRLFSDPPRWRLPRLHLNLGWLRLRWLGRGRLSSEEYEYEEEEYEEEEEEEPGPVPTRNQVGPKIVTRKRETRRPTKARPSLSEADGSYARPEFSLLDPPKPNEEAPGRNELVERSNILVEKLRNFGVQTRVTEVHPGPVITRYELEPAVGVKVGQVVNLQNDLALAMKATSVRIEAPIPGKGTVGIEIPNDRPSTVYFSEVIQSPDFLEHSSLLKIALGKGISGNSVVTDLESMPHLLIAGSTGSGKSVCINSIITGFLFTATPQDLSFILIDPKMLELTPYNGIPHLKCPVICDAKTAVRSLRWAVTEMENRYKLMARVGARDIQSYNDKVRDLEAEDPEEAPRKIPHLVIVIDELADLMLSMPNEIEGNIARLAQMGRAVGIHMVVATQRPSVDVITGVIKANFPCRMAFRVPSKTDSRTILDQNGAEALLGKGDMLFLASGKREVVRVHCCFVSLAEVERVVEHVVSQSMTPAEPFVDFTKSDAPTSARGKDSLFDEAARLVVKHQQGSVSLLQRRLTVGYARAARLIDMLEEAGIVGPFEGSKAREVLVSPEDFARKG